MYSISFSCRKICFCTIFTYTMKPIFSYIDYRWYLKEYYEEQKANSRCFSYRYFSQKAGINSPSFLKQVIESERNLTPLTINKFITALKLTEKEAAYFRHLVLFNQAKSATEKQEHYIIMLSMMHTVKELKLNALQHEYYNHWFVPVVRELVCLYNFKDDFKKIADTVIPPIQTNDARFAVKLLKKLEMIEQLPDGTYRQKDAAIISDSTINRMAVRSFNREMLRKAEAALDTISVDNRQIYGMTLGISKECYDVLTAEMQAFRDRIVTIVSRDMKSDSVYQLNLQLFPLSKHLENDKRTEENV